jgi:hypothetical protein
MSIQDFLVWLSGGVGATLVASYIAERSVWFQALKSDTKKVYTTVVSAILAIGAYLTFTYVPVEVWTVLSPYWQIVLAVIATNYGGQVFHFFDKKLEE